MVRIVTGFARSADEAGRSSYVASTAGIEVEVDVKAKDSQEKWTKSMRTEPGLILNRPK